MIEFNSSLCRAAPVVLYWQRRQQLRHSLDTQQTWDLHDAERAQTRYPVVPRVPALTSAKHGSNSQTVAGGKLSHLTGDQTIAGARNRHVAEALGTVRRQHLHRGKHQRKQAAGRAVMQA